MTASSASDIAAIRRHHQQMMAKEIEGHLAPEEITSFIREIKSEASSDKGQELARHIVAYWSAKVPPEAPPEKDMPPPSAGPEAPGTLPGPALPQKDAIPATIDGLEVLAAETARPPLQIPPAPTPPSDASAGADIQTMFRLGGLARQWRDSKQSAGYLLNGSALKEAKPYANNDPDIKALIEASEAAAEKERAAQMADARQKSRIYKWFFWLSVGALIVMAGLAYWLHEAKEEVSVRNKLLSDSNTELAVLAAELAKKSNTLSVQNTALAESESALKQYRTRTQEGLREAQPAWEALQRGDNTKIRELLTKLDALSSVDVPSPVAPQRTRPQGPAAPVPTANACRGFLWLGNAGDPKYIESEPLAAIKPNDTLTIEDNAVIRLRQSMPSASYVMSEQRGVVVGGARVRVVGQPKAFERPAGKQYWAEVDTALCARVFVQYAPTPAPTGKLQALLDSLRNLNVYVAPEQGLPDARGLAEIRFFYEEDRVAANRIASSLGASLASPQTSFNIVPLLNYPTLPTLGTIEVWIDLGRLR